MLEEISRADYGTEAGEHLRELRLIRDTGRVPVTFDWCPKEVLELTKWWEAGTGSRHGRTEAEEHLRRAFACAALLRGASEPGNENIDFFEPDLIALALASADALGPDAERAAGRFLAWRFARLPVTPDERGWFAIGVVMSAVRQEPERRDPEWLERLGWWVVELVRAEALGRGGVYWGQRYGVWQQLGVRMREDIRHLPPGSARYVLHEVPDLVTAP